MGREGGGKVRASLKTLARREISRLCSGGNERVCTRFGRVNKETIGGIRLKFSRVLLLFVNFPLVSRDDFENTESRMGN